jgi:GNAT superfamily N-acetyltransferase
MDASHILALFDRHERLEYEAVGFRREATPEVVRLVDLEGREGTVIFSQLTGDGADAAILGQIARFTELGQSFEWKTFGHDQPADLAARLRAHGLEAGEPEALLALELALAPASLLAPVRRDIRRITDPAQLARITDIQEAVWGHRDPSYVERLAGDLRMDPGHNSIYMAYADGIPVAHARITFRDGSPFAGLWGGSTLAEYRGLGLYTALLATRVQEAIGRGVRFLTIDASPMSRPIVERRGFQFLTMTQPFTFHPRGADA